MGLKKEKGTPMSLEEFKKDITKIYGENTIISALEKESYGDVIPCTSISLRNALGIGGFAKRKLYTIDGELSSGKSSTAYDVIGNCQKTFGDRCLLIDKEDCYTTSYGSILGIDNSLLDILEPSTLEDMYDILLKAIVSSLYGCIVVDSITAFAPEARHEGSVVMGLEARVNSDKMRLIMNALQKSKTCLIFIQQTRSAIGGFGDPTTVSGGVAIPFYASVRIRITRSKIDREAMQNVMKFTIIKNKLAAPYKVGTVVFKWNKGFDYIGELAELAVEFGIIKQEGRTYYFPESGDLKIVGANNMEAHLNDNPEYTTSVIEPMVINYINNQGLTRPDEGTEELQ